MIKKKVALGIAACFAGAAVLTCAGCGDEGSFQNAANENYYDYIIVDGCMHSGYAKLQYSSGNYSSYFIDYKIDTDCGQLIYTTCVSLYQNEPDEHAYTYKCEECFKK